MEEINIRCIPKFTFLSEKEITFVYHSAVELLEKTGVKVFNTDAQKLLHEAGVKAEDTLFFIPAKIVEEAIASAPKDVKIFDRIGRHVMTCGGQNRGGENTYFGTGSDLTHFYDMDTGEIRLTRAKDIGDMATTADALPHIDFLMSYGIPSDVPLSKTYQTEFLQMVTHSSKPIVFTADNYTVSKQILDMAQKIAGGKDKLREKPFVLHYTQPTSPLQHSDDAVGKMFAAAEAGIPVCYPPGMMPGATAPVTLTGAVIQSVAEALSGLVLLQLKHSGSPAVLCGAHGLMDMKTSVNVYAAPERLKTEAALAAVYQYFGIPTWGFGGCTDAMVLDEQAGFEFSLMTLWAVLTGVNLAHDTGYLGSGMVGDLRALPLNDEIIGYVRHLAKGMMFDRDHAALEVIQRVGPGGNYLMDDHTLTHFRTEFWEPGLSNRYNLSVWNEKGKFRMGDKLTEKVKDILATYNSERLDTKLEEEITALV